MAIYAIKWGGISTHTAHTTACILILGSASLGPAIASGESSQFFNQAQLGFPFDTGKLSALETSIP